MRAGARRLRTSAATATAPATRRRSTPRACRCCTSSPARTPTTTSRRDAPDGINAAGAAQMAPVVALGGAVARASERRSPTGRSPRPRRAGDARSFNASLGTIPDYAGPPGGQHGVLLLGGASRAARADQAGCGAATSWSGSASTRSASVEDLMYVLNASKPGETVTAVIKREGKEVQLETTFQETKRR